MRPKKERTFLPKWRVLTIVGLDWVQMAAAVYLAVWANSWPVSVLAIWFIGIKQYALSEVITHDASHYLLFAKKADHYRYEWLFSLPFFRTVREYRDEHIPHHAHLGDHDIDLLCFSYRAFNLQPIPTTWFAFQWFIKPILGYAFWYWLKNEFVAISWPRTKGTIAAYACVTIVSLKLGLLSHFVLFWIIPYLWCFTSFNYWQEIDDHYSATGIARNNRGWLRNLLSHNSGYHFSHHVDPTISCLQIKEATHLTAQCQDTSYGFVDSFRQMMTPKEQRLICFEQPNEEVSR